MDNSDRVSIKEGCKILGTYDALLTGMAARHGVKLHRKGRFRYILRADLERLRPEVEAWHNRPRLTDLATSAVN